MEFRKTAPPGPEDRGIPRLVPRWFRSMIAITLHDMYVHAYAHVHYYTVTLEGKQVCECHVMVKGRLI